MGVVFRVILIVVVVTAGVGVFGLPFFFSSSFSIGLMVEILFTSPGSLVLQRWQRLKSSLRYPQYEHTARCPARNLGVSFGGSGLFFSGLWGRGISSANSSVGICGGGGITGTSGGGSGGARGRGGRGGWDSTFSWDSEEFSPEGV